jgi:hypothetical protein
MKAHPRLEAGRPGPYRSPDTYGREPPRTASDMTDATSPTVEAASVAVFAVYPAPIPSLPSRRCAARVRRQRRVSDRLLLTLLAGVVALLVALPATARRAAAQADPAVSARIAVLNRAGDWDGAAALGRRALAADTTRSAERCRVIEAVAYAELFRDRRDSARAALAALDAECADVPIERAVRAEASRLRRVLDGAPIDSVFRRPDG